MSVSQTVDDLEKNAFQLLQTGEYKKALVPAEDYKSQILKLYGDQSKEYSLALTLIGSIYSHLGEYKTAFPYYLEASETLKNVFGIEHVNYALALNNLGGLYLRMGEYKKAEPFFVRSMAINKKVLGTEHPDYALSLNNLGMLYKNMGEYKKAESYFLESWAIRKKVLGTDHPDYALILNNLGSFYDEIGDLKKAEPYYLEALSIRENVLGTQHPDYALTLNNLGVLYSGMGDFKKAEFYKLEAIIIYKKVLGTEHPDYALSLNNLGWLYSKMGDLKKAEINYLEALAIRKKVLGPEHPDYARTLSDLGQLYNDMQDFKKAETYCLEAIAIQKKVLGTEHPDHALSLNNLGLLYSNMGDYKKAESYYLEANSFFKKALGIGHPFYALSLNNLAGFYLAIGDYNEAEHFYLEAVSIYQKILGTKHPDYATSLNNIAQLYFDIGNYSKAEFYNNEALSIRKEVFGIEHPHYATSLNNLGLVHMYIGNYEKALSNFLEAQNITKKTLGTNRLDYITLINNIGLCFEKMGEYNKSESYFLEALVILKEQFGIAPPEYTLTLNNLGLLYHHMKDYKKAEQYFLESLTIRKNILDTNHPLYALSLNNLGVLYSDMRHYEKAEHYLLETLASFKKILRTEHPDFALFLENFALFYLRNGKLKESLNYLKQSIGNTNKQIHKNFDFLSEKEKLYFIKSIQYRFDLNNSILFTENPYQKTEAISLYNYELQNKGLVLHSSRQLKSIINRSNDTLLITLSNHLIKIKQQLSKIYSQPKDKYLGNIQGLEEEAEQIEKQMVKKSQDYRKNKEQLETDWKRVQRHLNPNEAAIEFLSFSYLSQSGWTDSVIYTALVLRPGYIFPKYVYLFEEKKLLSLLKKENGNLVQSYINRLYQWEDNGNPLYQLIWQPLDSLLQDVSTLYVAPSSLLHNIALGAIPTPNSNTVKGKYGLQILGTTADIINKKDEFINDKSIQQAIVFGGINYDKASSKPIDFSSTATEQVYAYVPTDSARGATGKWNYLSGSLKEAEDVASQFKQQKITTRFFSDSTATETLFKKLPVENSSILHIATHGYFFPDIKRKREEGMQLMGEEKQTAFRVSENPLLRSGVIFAGANPVWTNPDYESTATDDGILTAYEISNMDLSNVKLVVLSACETGLGDIKGSEGVFGLQRSFKLAGVKNIIMSLWKVPDEKTMELMQLFYQNCFAGKSISEAFKATQEEMRTRYSKSPYFWAGFTLLQ